MNRRTLYINRPSIETFAKPIWAEKHWMYFESAEDLPKIRHDNRVLGFVYVVEYGDMIKIGFARDPRDRFEAKYKPALKYGYEPGQIYLSPAHRHYVETEHALHSHFAEYRIPRTELFRMKFSKKIPTIMCMALDQCMFDGAIQ